MVTTNATTLPVSRQQPPVVDRLRALFESLEDAPLLAALVGPTRRGPKGHSVRVLWRCFLAKHALGLPSTAAMIRMLQVSPPIADTCGIPTPDRIPHESTFSRFFARLASRKYLHLVKDVSRALVRRNCTEIPGFGRRVALDSTTLKAWSNGGKSRKSDPQAGWSVKRGTQGVNEAVYGYKLHLLVDCETQAPVAANISAGNVHDLKFATRVLREARYTTTKFSPDFVIADAGYSGKRFIHYVRSQHKAKPVIKLRGDMKHVIKDANPKLDSPEFKALFRQRTSVERCFAYLKGQHSLNHITTRLRKKVAVHCYLSLIAMQAMVTRAH